MYGGVGCGCGGGGVVGVWGGHRLYGANMYSIAGIAKGAVHEFDKMTNYTTALFEKDCRI